MRLSATRAVNPARQKLRPRGVIRLPARMTLEVARLDPKTGDI